MRSDRVRRFAAATVLGLGGVMGALVLAEAALRLEHFHFRAIPEVEFGWPKPEVIRNELLADPDLFWVTREYPQALANARAGANRVIFLGDSCVAWSGYPRRTMIRLAETNPELARGEKLGVPGWSSEQGRIQMARDVVPLRPTVITVQFGWNDHWDTYGPPDNEAHVSPMLLWTSDHVRVYQAYRKAVVGLEKQWEPDGPRRVSLARYRDNLGTIAEEGARIGARVVFITAPTSHVLGAEPDFTARHLHHLSMLVPLHQAYVQATRDVAAITGASLCDAADAMEKLGANRRFYFFSDGVHFNAQGDTFMGDFVAGCIASAVKNR